MPTPALMQEITANLQDFMFMEEVLCPKCRVAQTKKEAV